MKILDKTLKLGFEIECLCKDRNLDQFRAEVKCLNRNIDIGDDGSIVDEYGYPYSFELRTPPLPYNKSIVLLENLFKILNRNGKTNSSCGLHVNFSTATENFDKFNADTFLQDKIWRKISESFRRTNNDYCVFHKTKDIKELKRRCQDKYSFVNLGKAGKNNRNGRRIEVRSMGNANYHKKFKIIKRYVNKILSLFQISCGVKAIA